jgi:hypothetical protein
MAYNEKNAPRATINPDGSSFFFVHSKCEEIRMNSKEYGFLNFLGDVFMICLTCGFWLVWIFVREMRRR